MDNVESAGAGSYGVWRYVAPAGTRLEAVEAGTRLVKAAGHRPTLYVSNGTEGSLGPIAEDTADDGWRQKRWSAGTGGGKDEFGVRLKCNPPSGNSCPESSTALAWTRNLRLTLNDSSAPTALLDGSLLAPGWQSGVKSLAVSASDVGGGVHRIEVNANGSLAAQRAFDCATIPRTAFGRAFSPAVRSRSLRSTSTRPTRRSTRARTRSPCAWRTSATRR